MNEPHSLDSLEGVGGRHLVPSERLNRVASIESALLKLHSHGFDVKALWAEHRKRLAKLDVTELTDEDHTWATVGAKVPLSEHWENPLLRASRLVVGRQFTLTPGQRSVLRNRTGLTPTEKIEVTAMVMYPGTQVVFSMTLRSCLHVDPRLRKHLLVETVLQPAAEFFRDGKHEDDRLAAEAEKARFTARIDRLLAKAKKAGVYHEITNPEALANRLQSECEAGHITDQVEVRQQLRSILDSMHEHDLAKAVLQPKFFSPEDTEPAEAKIGRLALQYMDL